MGKAITRVCLLSITVFLALCTKRPIRPDNGSNDTGPGEGVCIYAAKGTISPLTGFYLDSASIAGKPLVCYDEIITYDTLNHILELGLTRDSLEKRIGPIGVYGAPFAVTLDSEMIYGGWFWAPYSSVPCHGVVIEPGDLFDSLFTNEIRIKLGTVPSDFVGEDPRSNQRIFERLVKDGKATGRGIRFRHSMLTEEENKKMTDRLNTIPPGTIAEFNDKYQAWENTWDNYWYCSNPWCYTEPEEYKLLLNYCKSKGTDIWALVFKTHFECELYDITALLVQELTWADYGCLAGQIHESIKADENKEYANFWTYYIQEILDDDNVKCNCQYIFTVTDTCKRPIIAGYPFDSLSADNYLPDSSGRSYCVRFSSDEDTVVIRGDSGIGIIIIDSVVGVIDTVTAEYRAYFIETLVTGGRFIVWTNTDPMRAEYTIYGSGLPIVWSERGVLKRVQ